MKTINVFQKILIIAIVSFLTIFSNNIKAQTAQNIDFSLGDYTNWIGYKATNYSSTYSLSFSAWTQNNNPSLITHTYTSKTKPCFIINSPSTPAMDWNIPTLKRVPTHLGYTHSSQINTDLGGANANKLSYDLNITSQNCLIIFNYALIYDSPGHVGYLNPFFIIEARLIKTNGTDSILLTPNSKFEQVGQMPAPNGWNQLDTNNKTFVWKDWSQVAINLQDYIGQTVRINYILAGCSPTAHFGYGYVTTKVDQRYDTIYAEICKGETYNQFGFNESNSGFYTDSVETFFGPDKVTYLDLTVHPRYNDTIFADICEGEIYNQFGFSENTTGFYTQNLQTISGCDSIINLKLVVRKAPKVQLEKVSVNNDNYNVIEWKKNEVVNHYNIYRETNITGQYDLIVTIPYDSISEYIDKNANPNVKAYMYKISTNDTCLNESELSPLHKTMHLTLSQDTGSNWKLNWTPYIGINYSTYNIFRGINTLDSLKYLTTISSNNTSYTDMNAPSGFVYYQIEIIIDTRQSKAEVNSIRSNYATNKLISIEGVQTTDNITTKLYPNPSDGKAILDVEGLNTEADVLVYDMVGRVVQRHSLNKGKNDLEIDLSGYAKGVYSVRIVNDSVNQTLKLIVR